MNLMGGFGNVLFQFMYGYSIARKLKTKLVFKCNELKRQHASKYTFLCEFNFVDNSLNYLNMSEKNHYYDEYNYNLLNDYNIIGYFQSFKYSKQYFDEIKQFIFYKLSNKIDKINKIYELINKNNKITITLHVRRTDYINYDEIHYVIRTEEWYENAIQLLLKKLNLNKDDILLILFSDDIAYLNNMNITKKYNNIIAENYNLDIEETFLLMSCSDNFIIPNSSYSLLSYYFRKNNDATIIIPNKWFGNKGPSYKINDIIELNNNVIIQNV